MPVSRGFDLRPQYAGRRLPRRQASGRWPSASPLDSGAGRAGEGRETGPDRLEMVARNLPLHYNDEVLGKGGPGADPQPTWALSPPLIPARAMTDVLQAPRPADDDDARRSASPVLDPDQPCPHLESLPVASRSALLVLLGKACDVTSPSGNHVCCDCSAEVADDLLTICLQCAPKVDLRCGRYHQQHAEAHFQQSGHSVSARLRSTSVWCYVCDQEVFLPDDDDGQLQTDDSPYQSDNGVSPAPIAADALPDSYPNSIAKFRDLKGYLGDQAWKLSANRTGGTPGLFNIGNTCFLNSGLQAILHVPQVIDVFAQRRFLEDDVKYGSIPERLLSSFTELVMKVWSGQYSTCSPRELLRQIWALNSVFRGYDQQDTQELLRCLLNGLHDALKHSVPIRIGSTKRIVERSIVSDLFEGLLLSQVTCENCFNVSETYDPFMDLSLEIPSKQQLKKAGDDPSARWSSASASSMLSNFLSALSWNTPILTLDMCLQSFCARESLIRLDQYSCEKCQQKVNASKVLSIGRCPELLTLHIKRFAHNHFFGSKLTTAIEFPLDDLDLLPYIRKSPPPELAGPSPNDSCLYSLVSIVKHMGSVNGGHYVAYARHHLTGVWYEFDDQRCTPVSEDTVRSQEAYILVYRRKTASKALSRPFDKFLEATLSLVDDLPQVCLSLYWLKRAELFSNPGPIDNWSLCCEHGVARPGSHVYKRALPISATAWKTLQEKFGGGPMVPVEPDAGSLCPQCLTVRRKHESQRITNLMDEYDGDRDVYLISEHWLAQWKQFISGGDVPGPIDNGVLFEKGGTGLRPGLTCPADYKGVNAPTWKELYRIYGGGPVVSRSTEDLYDTPASTS